MLVRLLVMNGTTTNVMDAEALNSGVRNTVNTVASTASWSVEPLTWTLWIIALVAVGILWYAHTEKPYLPERLRRNPGVGPMTHLRNTIINKYYSFLP